MTNDRGKPFIGPKHARRRGEINAAILFRLAIAALICLGLDHEALAQRKEHPTADLLSELIRVDTSNPPGNEGKLDELLAAKFRPLDFEIEIIPTPEPGKAHFIARIKGDG